MRPRLDDRRRLATFAGSQRGIPAMSLFENNHYRWRETYFVLFNHKHRPSLDAMKATVKQLGKRYELTEIRVDTEGRLESLTLNAPYDYAAMDITYITGEDVAEQVAELTRDMKGMALTPEEKLKLKRLPDCDARFDVYHFEQIVDDEEATEEEEFLDPGALLIVLESLAKLCHGVGIDPQSGAVM
jgi:hypothetical protein